MSTQEILPPADEEHSSLVGGSTAERRIFCPRSYALENMIPKSIRDKSSSYADEGTALHEAIQFILNENVTDLDEIVGRTFYDHVMTQKLVDEALAPCVDFFEALEDDLEEEGGIEFLTEQRVEFPGLPGAFGTADVPFRTFKRSGVIDWKFGEGVPVKAIYTDDETGEPYVNPQLMFYATAAAFSLPSLFPADDDDWPISLYIVQPRCGDGPTFTEAHVTVGDLKAFRSMLIGKLAEARGATGEDATIRKGPWCRFAPCKAICPLHTGPLIDAAKLAPKVLAPTTQVAKRIDWDKLLPDLLDTADVAEAVAREIRAIAHSYLEAGRPIEGWKLVPKRAQRKWRDPEEAEKWLKKKKVTDSVLYTPRTLRSVAQLETALKKADRKDIILDETQPHGLVSKVSSGTTIAREGDARQDITATTTLVQRLAEKLSVV